jgi:hydrogenase maturation protein HypF
VNQGLEPSRHDATGATTFEIRESEGGAKSALVLPDIATCADCVADLFDEGGRRFRYPFTNCTNCGPRFTIIQALPYDRPATTMAGFVMCERCRAEYEDPRDRRFHAQPNACPDCGPRLALWDATGAVRSTEDQALCDAARLVAGGAILALKGLGGFHLVVDASNDAAVRRLREAKAREEKPFALMCPDTAWAERLCEVSPLEARLLESAEAPIVLMRRREGSRDVAPSVAPGHPLLGVMLPYTPLHHLLMREVGRPCVATSGNRTDEPICIDEREALVRLAGLCDAFLVHDRAIVRPVDDSIVRVVLGRELVLRRARGYAPLPVTLPTPCTEGQAVLAVGAHLKSAVALGVGGNAFISQHLGDLETPEAYTAFGRAVDALRTLYEASPTRVACDAHPVYRSTVYADESGVAATRVQHHVAHVLACMAENEVEAPTLGVAWDGTGFGMDATIWGGEFFLLRNRRIRRVASLRTFRLPGGDQAIREPRRIAMGLLFEHLGPAAFERGDLAPVASLSETERRVLLQMLARGLNSPLTSSVGRLFDAVASLAGIRQQVRYEGQAAMELEFAAGREAEEPYPFALHASDMRPTADPAGRPPDFVLDWAPAIDALLTDLARGVAVTRTAARFHAMLAAAIAAVATAVGEPRVVLSGGCFQNAWLTECAVYRLRQAGFKPYWHQRVPPNDGGIALGQLVAVAGGWNWSGD